MLNQLDYTKSTIKSPMHNGLIKDFGLYESTLDYIFQTMGFRGPRIDSDIVYSESFANPYTHRKTTMELLFECYGVQRILPVVNCLLTGYESIYGKPKDLKKHPLKTGLLVHIGYMSTTVIPCVDGVVNRFKSRRIPIGTKTIYDYFCRLMALQYPYYSKYLDHHILSKLYHKFMYCPTDYDAQLRYFKFGTGGFKTIGYAHKYVVDQNKYFLEKGMHLFREPAFIEIIESSVVDELSPEEKERRHKMRVEFNSRIRETNKRKNIEKLERKREDLAMLSGILKEIKDCSDEEEVKEILFQNDFESVREMELAIRKLKIDLGIITKEQLEKDRFCYIDVPDSKLTTQQLRQKRFQLMHKKNAELKEIKKHQREKEAKKIHELKTHNPEQYLSMLHLKREKVLEKLKKMNNHKNTSRKVNQKNMMLIIDSYCSGIDTKKIEEDISNFGIFENLEEHREKNEKKLQEIEDEIRDFDPKFEVEIERRLLFSLTDNNSIEFSVESIRPVEILFKPYLIGIKKMGLIELMEAISGCFGGLGVKDTLLSNVVLTGSGTDIEGIKQRVEHDLRSLVNFEREIKVSAEKNQIFAPWKSMKEFYLDRARDDPNLWVTKQMYLEGELFRETNRFYENNLN